MKNKIYELLKEANEIQDKAYDKYLENVIPSINFAIYEGDWFCIPSSHCVVDEDKLEDSIDFYSKEDMWGTEGLYEASEKIRLEILSKLEKVKELLHQEKENKSC